MNHDHYDNSWLKAILEQVTTIAVVGASVNPARPSHGVMKFLIDKGYHVIPVNPGLAGKEILGQKVYARLADISEKIDMVDVFRAADQLSNACTLSFRYIHLNDNVHAFIQSVRAAFARSNERAGL